MSTPRRRNRADPASPGVQHSPFALRKSHRAEPRRYLHSRIRGRGQPRHQRQYADHGSGQTSMRVEAPQLRTASVPDAIRSSPDPPPAHNTAFVPSRPRAGDRRVTHSHGTTLEPGPPARIPGKPRLAARAGQRPAVPPTTNAVPCSLRATSVQFKTISRSDHRSSRSSLRSSRVPHHTVVFGLHRSWKNPTATRALAASCRPAASSMVPGEYGTVFHPFDIRPAHGVPPGSAMAHSPAAAALAGSSSNSAGSSTRAIIAFTGDC